uniref:(northern house mosquito) hypothetical protein n=1 Tax=Culex pipiens TaxID=7175 RepID=A0A8D8PJE7_CULPI
MAAPACSPSSAPRVTTLRLGFPLSRHCTPKYTRSMRRTSTCWRQSRWRSSTQSDTFCARFRRSKQKRLRKMSPLNLPMAAGRRFHRAPRCRTRPTPTVNF